MRRIALLALLLLASGVDRVLAQQPIAGNSSQPIDIVADRLTVEQNQQVATFSGNVQAVQGEMTLTADLLRVHYAKGEGGGGGIGQGSAVRRIEAEGKVRLSNPTDTAEGDKGVYDVAGQKVTLDGNVVLTSGTNVVKGASLDMDLRTNVSTVHGQTSGTQPQRVRALFTPEKQGS